MWNFYLHKLKRQDLHCSVQLVLGGGGLGVPLAQFWGCFVRCSWKLSLIVFSPLNDSVSHRHFRRNPFLQLAYRTLTTTGN